MAPFYDARIRFYGLSLTEFNEIETRYISYAGGRWYVERKSYRWVLSGECKNNWWSSWFTQGQMSAARATDLGDEKDKSLTLTASSDDLSDQTRYILTA